MPFYFMSPSLKPEGTELQDFYKAALIRNGKISGACSADWSDAVASSTAAVGIWLAVISRKCLPI